MLREILRFEIIYRLRRPLLYVFAAFFFILPFGAISTDSVMVGGAIGNVARNAPYVIVEMLMMMSAIGLLFLTIFVAPAVNRDNEENVQELFFSTPLTKPAYIFGRYAGSVIPVIIAMFMSCAGIFLASIMPYQDPEYIQAFSAMPYIFAMTVLVIPNMMLMGAIFFSISTLSRRNFSAYVGVIVMMALWGLGAALLSDLEHQTLSALIDPFGVGAFNVVTRYWTIAERNTMLPPLTGLFLANRLLWSGIAVAVMIFTWLKYRMALPSSSGGRKVVNIEADEAPARARLSGFAAACRFDPRARLAQLWSLTRFETRSILRSIPFLIITLFGMANLFGGMIANPEGSTSYPLTQHMLEMIEGAFAVMPWLVIIIYGAEIVWKDERVRIDGIVGALPVSNWIRVTSRLGALFTAMIVMAVGALVCTVSYQAMNGYFDFQPLLYFKGLFILLLGQWLLLCVLSVFLQILAGNRYLGTLLMVGAFVLNEVLPETGLDHRLYLFSELPRAPWSDMNGYGHFGPALAWFQTYWSIFAAILAVLTTLLWVGGRDRRPGVRLKLFASRMTARPVTALVALTVLFVLTGSWIFYNTNVLNEYQTSKEIRQLAADYENTYGRYEGIPQPKVVAAAMEVEIYPHERKVDIGGRLTLVNKSEGPVDSLHINIARSLDRTGLSISGAMPAGDPEQGTMVEAVPLIDDRDLGYRIYSLSPPLDPGDTLYVDLDLSIEEKGFMNGRTNLRIVENGTFFYNGHYIPSIGYDPAREIHSRTRRRELGLVEKERLPAVDDPEALMYTFTRDSDRIEFEAIVGTSGDQTAIAPGDLIREWSDGGRNYYHYRTDRPILNFYCFVSGRYEVAREMCGETEIEIFYHHRHGMNVPRMMESATKSLSHYSATYSPYPFRQLRIVEFPGYRRFAQSFSTTIPFSEAANFTEDLTDETTLDMVFFITSHEIAHQWFAHQVTPASVQGAEMIGESLTQYSAFMVMEKDYGPDRMKRFLRYELDRYLIGRSQELREEMPLMLTEEQAYIHYNKGGMVLYAMRDYLGAEVMNGVLRDYVAKTAYVGPPYTNTLEFMSVLRPAVPDQFSYLVEDMFETITLYDNRMESAAFEETPEGRFRVSIEYLSSKMRSDGKGYETEVPHNDWIEVGIFGPEDESSGELGKVLYKEKHRLENGKGRLEIMVDERPVRAGIDPRNILIDRVPGDNVKKVSEG